MPRKLLDRRRLVLRPLAERVNRCRIEEIRVGPETEPREISAEAAATIDELAGRIGAARAAGRPVVLAFGAHAIKNGLGPLLAHLAAEGWVTHLATNGAGIIHDWELAFQGETSEHVRENVARGTFGLWEETGFHLNLALAVGAFEGLGYGESVGALIERDGLQLPSAAELERAVRRSLPADPRRAAAAADLLTVMLEHDLSGGRLTVPHPFKEHSVQRAAFALDVPFTAHPMFGHDIIYTHPLNHGACVGRTAERDFLRFAAAIAEIEDGVYISVGSAVMSPMIFEKSMSMAQNLALQQGKQITRHFICVVDLAESHWDWSRGEPGEDRPEYYLRYLKSFSRMGGTMRYLSLDNRDFLLQLSRCLAHRRTPAAPDG